MTDLIPEPTNAGAERLPDPAADVHIGDWFWVKGTSYRDPDAKEWLGCIVEIGSNYFELRSVWDGGCRIHADEFAKLCRREADVHGYIDRRIGHYKGEVNRLLGEINALTTNLGLAPVGKVDHATEPESRALSTLNGTTDMKAYKQALIVAKKEQLPALFKEVEQNTEALTTWMKATAIPIKAKLGDMKDAVAQVEDRIFNVELYAGLTEQVKQIRDGKPASVADKVHLMQNRLYMDEECLLEYQAGGMCFKNLDAFDKWLCQSGRFDELFPFPRCIVSWRVRRNMREHGEYSSLLAAFIAIQESELDKLTFLYIRNGDQLYRMRCELDFGEQLFPDVGEFDMSEPMMVLMSGSSVRNIMPKREWHSLVDKREQAKRDHTAWWKANKGKKVDQKVWRSGVTTVEKRAATEHDSPHYSAVSHDSHDLRSYEPFDKSSVHYDDACAKIATDIKAYNRVALILQGLLDRSTVLHPHPPARLYTNEGFRELITLVYDRDRTLHYGEPPDFDAYRAELNDQMRVGSITIGQELEWMKHEAGVENARVARSWRRPQNWRELDTFRPYGNDGPGYLGEVKELTRTKATFRWDRQRLRRQYSFESATIPDSIAVKRELLFNVSAYKLGDYKRFFQDPRTRKHYLQWAPFLLAAEDFHAGKSKWDVGADKPTKRKKD